MTIDLSASVTGVTDLVSLEFRQGMSQAASTLEVIAITHSLSIGDSVDCVMMGTTVMTAGIVRKIIQRVPEMDYIISVQDLLCRALDYYIVSDNPATPYVPQNIKAEDLVEVMLGFAGLTLTEKQVTIFTLSTSGSVGINLISAWSEIELLNRITGFDTYADGDGLIHFVERYPYITGSDTVSDYSFTTGSGTLLEIEYERSTISLANRIVVYGGENNELFYTASAVSPYLPVDFYKTIVVAHPIIDNMASVIATANVNLAIFNRLTQTCTIKVVGDATISARNIVDVTESFTGLTSATKWLVFDVMHTLGEAGFVSSMTLVR